MATFFNVNRQTGAEERITLPLDHLQILAACEELPRDHWLWFHLARWVRDNGPEAQEKAASLKMTIAFLADSFLLAQGMGLKSPMIRLHFKSQRFKISLSKPKAGGYNRYTGRSYKGSKGGAIRFDTGDLAVKMDDLPGSPVRYTSDPVGDERYLGTLFGGKFLGAREGYGSNAPLKPLTPVEQEVIDGLTADAPGFLARCSKDMDRCCYCNKPLEDQRSKEVGYGATCAVRWGLPWGTGRDESVPSFASLWLKANPDDRYSIRGICAGIRAESAKDNPDYGLMETGWAMLRDLLQDAGWTGNRLPQMPDRSIMLCRA